MRLFESIIDANHRAVASDRTPFDPPPLQPWKKHS
jgi:hypothetical protein